MANAETNASPESEPGMLLALLGGGRAVTAGDLRAGAVGAAVEVDTMAGCRLAAMAELAGAAVVAGAAAERLLDAAGWAPGATVVRCAEVVLGTTKLVRGAAVGCTVLLLGAAG